MNGVLLLQFIFFLVSYADIGTKLHFDQLKLGVCNDSMLASGGHGDDIITLIDHVSPRPWRLEKVSDSCFRIKDANGYYVLYYYEEEGGMKEEDATLIVDAVNEYDGKHTFCTQDCVWMGDELERLKKENWQQKSANNGMNNMVSQCGGKYREMMKSVNDFRTRMESILRIAEDAFCGPERDREASQSHALDLIAKAAMEGLGLDVYGGGE